MLFFVGLFGVALAGAAALAPFDALGSEDETEDLQDPTSGDGSTSDIADILPPDSSLESSPAPEVAPVVGTSSDGPDMMDEVYGQHMGDALGGNLFETLLFDDHASTGGVGNDTLTGGVGADLIVGNEGSDSITGSDGRDMLIGDAGDDTLMGGSQTDVLRGGDGNDVLRGENGDDLLTGGEGDDLIAGNAGDDHLFGQLGADTLIGGIGNDFLDGTHAATTSPAWTDEDDADLIFGGDGEDTLVLGAGDFGFGGDDADVFAVGHYEGTPVVPVIKDFNPAEDEIQLLYDASQGAAAGMTTVVDGTDVLVQLDGAPVARVEGLASIDVALIKLVPLPTA